MFKNNRIHYFNLLFLLLTLYINYSSVTGGLGGKSIRELSDKYDNLFTPAPQTFGIWSIIYTLLLINTVRSLFSKKNIDSNFSYYFIASCILNAGWIIAWQLECITLSLIIMLSLLTVLTKIALRHNEETLLIEKLAFGIYLGWICIATITNTTTQIVALNFSLPINLQIYITHVIILIGTGITLWVSATLKNWTVLLSVIWAFYGIYSKRNLDFPTIAIVAASSAIFIVLITTVQFLKKR